MKTITKKKTALTKSVFRQFNRKTAAGRRETVAMLAETLGAGFRTIDIGGKANLHVMGKL